VTIAAEPQFSGELADSSSWPSVTVVVPTRDRPELLRQAIDAILGQEYPGDVRVIVVFDQSEPQLSLVRADEHRGVLVRSNTRSPGLAGARNSGISIADTDLVAFCDDDDHWLPGKLQAQVEALRTHPNAVLAGCGIRIQYDGESVDRLPATTTVTFRDLLRSRLSELHPSTVLVRRKALETIGLVSEEIPGSYAEDYEWLLRVARAGDIVMVGEPLVSVLWHRKSYFVARWQMIVDALTWLLAHYPEFQQEPAGAARVEGQIAFASAAQGKRRDAVRWAMRTLRHNPREMRAPLALGVAAGLAKPDTVLRALHKRGKGI
jgi:glycosyltransferase involved in cell wall biosynthesis